MDIVWIAILREQVRLVYEYWIRSWRAILFSHRRIYRGHALPA